MRGSHPRHSAEGNLGHDQKGVLGAEESSSSSAIGTLQGTEEILAIEDILDKDTSEYDPPTAGEPTEQAPDVDTLSRLCRDPRPLVADDIF